MFVKRVHTCEHHFQQETARLLYSVRRKVFLLQENNSQLTFLFSSRHPSAEPSQIHSTLQIGQWVSATALTNTFTYTIHKYNSQIQSETSQIHLTLQIGQWVSAAGRRLLPKIIFIFNFFSHRSQILTKLNTVKPSSIVVKT